MQQLLGNWRWLGVPAGIVGAILLFTSLGAAQPQPKDKPRPPDRERPLTDPALEAWIKTLAERMTDRHDTIRDSARQALVGVGRPALPVLHKLADGEDGATAVAARKVMTQIENGGGPRGLVGGPGAQGAFPGGPPPFGGRGGPGGPPGPGGPGPMELAELNLSRDQQTRMRDIHETHHGKVRDLFEKARENHMPPQEVRAAHEKLCEEMFKEIKTVLTEDQYKRFEAAVKNRGPGGPSFGPPGGPGGPQRGPGPGAGGEEDPPKRVW